MTAKEGPQAKVSKPLSDTQEIAGASPAGPTDPPSSTTETVQSASTPAPEAPPEWLADHTLNIDANPTAAGSTESAEGRGSAVARASMVSIVIKTLVLLHKRLARWRQCDAWLLDEDEQDIWRDIISWGMDYLPEKDWPIIFTFISLGAMYAGKISEDLASRKEFARNEPSTR